VKTNAPATELDELIELNREVLTDALELFFFDRELLEDHVAYLQKLIPVAERVYTEIEGDELREIIKSGVKRMTAAKLIGLAFRPIALFQISDEMQEVCSREETFADWMQHAIKRVGARALMENRVRDTSIDELTQLDDQSDKWILVQRYLEDDGLVREFVIGVSGMEWRIGRPPSEYAIGKIFFKYLQVEQRLSVTLGGILELHPEDECNLDWKCGNTGERLGSFSRVKTAFVLSAKTYPSGSLVEIRHKRFRDGELIWELEVQVRLIE
jgi:hypothetical protein